MAAIDNTGWVTFTGSVTGDPPPGMAPIDLACYLYLAPPGTTYGETYQGFTNTMTRDFQIVFLYGGYPAGGTGTWKVMCYPTAPGSATAEGTVEFLPYS